MDLEIQESTDSIDVKVIRLGDNNDNISSDDCAICFDTLLSTKEPISIGRQDPDCPLCKTKLAIVDLELFPEANLVRSRSFPEQLDPDLPRSPIIRLLGYRTLYAYRHLW
eukprot:41672_1